MVIGIIFLILFAFFGLCLIGSLGNITKILELMLKRQDEMIRITKNSKKQGSFLCGFSVMVARQSPKLLVKVQVLKPVPKYSLPVSKITG